MNNEVLREPDLSPPFDCEPAMLNVHQRLQRVIADAGPAAKTGQRTQHVPFDFFRADDVIAHIRPHCYAHGLEWEYTVKSHELREIQRDDGRPVFVTIKELSFCLINVDDPEDYIQGTEVGYGFDFSDKGPGKATSYAVKTWLLNTFKLRGQPDVEDTPDPKPAPVRKPKDSIREAKAFLAQESARGVKHLYSVWKNYPEPIRSHIMGECGQWWAATKLAADKADQARHPVHDEAEL